MTFDDRRAEDFGVVNLAGIVHPVGTHGTSPVTNAHLAALDDELQAIRDEIAAINAERDHYRARGLRALIHLRPARALARATELGLDDPSEIEPAAAAAINLTAQVTRIGIEADRVPIVAESLVSNLIAAPSAPGAAA